MDDEWARLEPLIPPAKPGGRVALSSPRRISAGIKRLCKACMAPSRGFLLAPQTTHVSDDIGQLGRGYRGKSTMMRRES